MYVKPCKEWDTTIPVLSRCLKHQPFDKPFLHSLRGALIHSSKWSRERLQIFQPQSLTKWLSTSLKENLWVVSSRQKCIHNKSKKGTKCQRFDPTIPALVLLQENKMTWQCFSFRPEHCILLHSRLVPQRAMSMAKKIKAAIESQKWISKTMRQSVSCSANKLLLLTHMRARQKNSHPPPESLNTKQHCFEKLRSSQLGAFCHLSWKQWHLTPDTNKKGGRKMKRV